MQRYIHPTTSSVLALATETNFELCDINTSLYTHKLAPLSEKIGGSLGGITDKGAICFVESNDSYWSRTSLLADHSKMAYQQQFKSIKDFTTALEQCCHNGLSNAHE